MTDPLLVTPAADPITLLELKDHLGVTDDSQDAMLFRLLARARRQVEWLTNLGLASETWERSFDACDVRGDKLLLGRAPVTSITSVTAQHSDGTSSVMAAAGYYRTRDSLALVAGATWPTSLRTYEALTVRFVAGEIPIEGSGLREAVLKLAAWTYALRGDQDQGGAIPPDVWDALAPYRSLGVA